MLALEGKRRMLSVIVRSRSKRPDSIFSLEKAGGESLYWEYLLLLFVQEEGVIPKVAQLEARVRVQIHELQESERTESRE